MNTEQAVVALQTIRNNFIVLADTEGLYDTWEALVAKHQVSGKATHDTRIAAAMLEHGQASILTFNTADCRRFSDIKAIRPDEIASGLKGAIR